MIMNTKKNKNTDDKDDSGDKRENQDKGEGHEQRITLTSHGFTAGIGLPCKCFTITT